MTAATELRAALSAELRLSAEGHSKASKMLADAKTARQNDPRSCSDYLRPEQTVEGRAAVALDAAQERIAALEGALRQAKGALDTIGANDVAHPTALAEVAREANEKLADLLAPIAEDQP